MNVGGPVRPRHLVGLMALAVAASLSGEARAQPAASCTFDPGAPAGAPPGGACSDQLVCLPRDLGPGRRLTQIRAGAPGSCGRCTDAPTEADRDGVCGGVKCLPSGLCQTPPPVVAPAAVWPRFHLFVTDLSFNFADEAPLRPILGTGYLFQGAFHKVRFDPHPRGGFVATELPRLYFDGGGFIALAGPAQNVFAQLGLTYYWPGGPVGVTSLSLGGLYQRQGARIWRLDDRTGNLDRLGPVVTVGVLQSLFVRASYAFAVRGTPDEGAFLLSLTYMKSLATDVLPAQLIAVVPDSWQPN